MSHIRVLVVLAIVAVTSFVLVTNAADSIAQNDTTTTMDNQSSGAVNDTGMENATVGNISGFLRGQ